MNDMIVASGGMPATMTSLDIAEVVNSRHDDVKRSLRRLADRGVIQLPPLAEVKNHLGQTVQVFTVGERDSYVVVAQLSPEFTARLVDYWQHHKKQQPAVNLSDPMSLRTLLLQHVDKVIELETRIEADKPKTTFYDAFVNADGLYNLQNAARALQCGPNLYVRWLKQKYLFYQGTALVPYIQFIKAGIFEVKSEIIGDKARPRTFVTAKGLEYFAERVPEAIKVGRES